MAQLFGAQLCLMVRALMGDEIVQSLELTTKAGAAALVSRAAHKGLLA